MAVAPPAAEPAFAELQRPVAEEAVVRAEPAAFQRGQGHDHLEGRSRRVLAGDRLVGEREARMGDQLPPLPSADAGGEQVGVVARHRRQRQDVARMDIEHHGRAAFLAEACRDVLLEPEVDGQHVIVARPAGPAAELADHAAVGVDLDLPGAGLAAQRGLQHLLGAVLADAEVGQAEQRVVRPLQVGLVHGADVADDVDRVVAEGVEPASADVDHHAGEVGRVDLDLGDLLPRQVLAHRDGHELLVAPGLAQHPLAVVVLDRHELGDFVQRLVKVQRRLGHQDQPIVEPVLGKHLAEAVEDAAPRRRQELHVDAVLVGQDLVALGVDDLELIETPGEPGGQQRLRAADDDGPAREEVGASRLAAHLSGALRLRARREGGRTARRPGRGESSGQPGRRSAEAERPCRSRPS